jgi:5'-nucleotidase
LSGCSHQVHTHKPLRVTEMGASRFAVDGTPADCVRLGLLHLATDANWIAAGINEGGNLGVDVYLSGTVAAVREAALFGKSAVAFSQYRRTRDPVDWPAAAKMAGRVMEAVVAKPLAPGAFWNANFPQIDDRQTEPPLVFCPLDPHQLPIEYEFADGAYHFRGVYQQRARDPGADVDVCFGGAIAVTEVLPCPSR